jgi:hypothetical protein
MEITNQWEDKLTRQFYLEVRWFANYLIPVETSSRLPLVLLLVVTLKSHSPTWSAHHEL